MHSIGDEEIQPMAG